MIEGGLSWELSKLKASSDGTGSVDFANTENRVGGSWLEGNLRWRVLHGGAVPSGGINGIFVFFGRLLNGPWVELFRFSFFFFFLLRFVLLESGVLGIVGLSYGRSGVVSISGSWGVLGASLAVRAVAATTIRLGSAIVSGGGNDGKKGESESLHCFLFYLISNLQCEI